MKAVELIFTRIVYSESAFAELILWHLPTPVEGSLHMFKYRLAYVVSGKCVLRYDNESGKGDHRHYNGEESVYAFTTPEQVIADFQKDIARWNHENPDT
jgi:nitrate/nitrite-specific signal transduction histidine kinase